MKNLDSLTLKFFYEENKNFLDGAVIQKIQMPKRREILLYLRNNGENKKFYINIDPKYPHICFIEDKEDYSIKIPKTPPMFCMQLRKHLEGAKIVHSNLVQYDRILEFYFFVSDEFGIENSYCLSIELMGKYSNVILYNKKTGLITGSAHNVSADKSSVREIYGGIKYIYPPLSVKNDILKTSFGSFLNLKNDINANFYYFSKPFVEFLKKEDDFEFFKTLQNAQAEPDLIKEFWETKGNFNEIIFSYFSKIVNADVINGKKTALLKIINSKIKKLDSIINEKIDFQTLEKYKKYGDLIFQYIYLVKEGEKCVTLDGFEIPMDETLTPAQNAQKYYKLYSKIKSKKEISNKRKEEAKNSKKYLEEILFSIQNANNINTLDEIEEEISNSPAQNKIKPYIETVNFMGYKILIGKNNKQNDYLIRKMSDSEDIWFHALNCPSAHVILKIQDKNKVPNEVMLYAANLVKENSPFKNSGKAPIIYTKRKCLKRPPDTPLGYVTYNGEKEIVL